jgi:hypothetical protein
MRVSFAIFVRGLRDTLRRNGSTLTSLSLNRPGETFDAGLQYSI